MKFIKCLTGTFVCCLLLLQLNLVSFESISNQVQYDSELYHSLINNKANSFEIDKKVYKVAEELGGGIYRSEVEAIVPFFPSHVKHEWLRYKNEIMERIGPVFPRQNKESNDWANSARLVDDLLNDARKTANYFREKCLQIAIKTNSVVSFGIHDQSIIKSKASLLRKVKQTANDSGISQEEAVSRIRDVLRGTIIVETPEQIPSIIEAIKEFAHGEEKEVVFVNVWEENRPSGYVGIHAKLMLSVVDEIGLKGDRDIIVEIQIHLKCVMDGTPSCVKEREHLLYEHKRNGKSISELQTSASTLLYLTALKQCPKSLIPKNIAWQFQKLNHLTAVPMSVYPLELKN